MPAYQTLVLVIKQYITDYTVRITPGTLVRSKKSKKRDEETELCGMMIKWHSVQSPAPRLGGSDASPPPPTSPDPPPTSLSCSIVTVT